MTTQSAGGTYGHLRDVAVRLLSDSPAGIDDVTLASALFGASTGGRWHLLLASVLGGDPRLRHDNGRWCIATRAVPSLDDLICPPESTTPSEHGEAIGRADRWLLSDVSARLTVHPTYVSRARTDQTTQAQPEHGESLFEAGSSDREESASTADARLVGLALATTGADPNRHRVTRIAVVHREAGEIVARFDVELGGEWRSRWRGQPENDLGSGQALPEFAQILPRLLDFIGGLTVYAYGARRAWAFLDAERRRAGLAALEIRLRELDERICEIVAGSKKPGLLVVAEELGIPPLSSAGRSSALGEADLVARVLERLNERQVASPGRSALAGTAVLPDEPDAVDMSFTDAWLAGIPAGPGVYVVEDATATALYVGKAVALRTRLSAYVSKPLSRHRRFEALGVRAARIRTLEACSDLEATLLETWLIRQLQPTFNTAREVREAATRVRAASDDPTPRVHLVGESRSDGARYFGPFESATAARQARDVARAVYPAAFERRRGDVAAQRQAVLDVVLLLSGQKDAAIGRVRQLMSSAVAAGDRTEVDRLRVALREIQDLTIRPSILVGLTDGWRLLVLEHVAEPSCEIGRGRLHLIQDGRLLRSASTQLSTLPTRPPDLLALADAMLAEVVGDDADEKWSPADSAIVMRWLVQARQRIEVARLPATEPDDVV